MRAYGWALMIVWMIAWGGTATMAEGGGGCDPHGAMLRAEMIFPLEAPPTPGCHASTIAQTRDGHLVAAWFAGADEGEDDVGIWVSRLDKGTWSKPVEVANGVMSPQRRYPCWNPVLFQPKKGPLALFFKVGCS